MLEEHTVTSDTDEKCHEDKEIDIGKIDIVDIHDVTDTKK
jgi:hypothetical protein